MLRFGILGPLLVAVDGNPVPVPAAKQRTVLAALLVRANQVVATDELIEILWDGRPPSSAAVSAQASQSADRA